MPGAPPASRSSKPALTRCPDSAEDLTDADDLAMHWLDMTLPDRRRMQTCKGDQKKTPKGKQQKFKEASIKSVAGASKKAQNKRHDGKDKRQRARQEARAFKEVDGYLAALGLPEEEPPELPQQQQQQEQQQHGSPAAQLPGCHSSLLLLGRSSGSSSSHRDARASAVLMPRVVSSPPMLRGQMKVQQQVHCVESLACAAVSAAAAAPPMAPCSMPSAMRAPGAPPQQPAQAPVPAPAPLPSLQQQEREQEREQEWERELSSCALDAHEVFSECSLLQLHLCEILEGHELGLGLEPDTREGPRQAREVQQLLRAAVAPAARRDLAICLDSLAEGCERGRLLLLDLRHRCLVQSRSRSRSGGHAMLSSASASVAADQRHYHCNGSGSFGSETWSLHGAAAAALSSDCAQTSCSVTSPPSSSSLSFPSPSSPWSSYQEALGVVAPEMVSALAAAAAAIGAAFAAAQTDVAVRAATGAGGKLLGLADQVAREALVSSSSSSSSCEDTAAAGTDLLGLSRSLADQAAEVAAAAAAACCRLAGQLLVQDRLCLGGCRQATAAWSKAIQEAWLSAVELSTRVWRLWPCRKGELQKRLLSSLMTAAQGALDMHTAWLPECEEEEEEGVVGCNLEMEDLQGHVWVPDLMSALVDRVCVLHWEVREQLLHDRLAELAPADRSALAALLKQLQLTLAKLVIANTRRTALLLSRPRLLPDPALDILSTQAEKALRLVQKWDKSSLSLAALLSQQDIDATQLFLGARDSTQRVVNGLLSVRSLVQERSATQQLPQKLQAPLPGTAAVAASGHGAGTGSPVAGAGTVGAAGGSGVQTGASGASSSDAGSSAFSPSCDGAGCGVSSTISSGAGDGGGSGAGDGAGSGVARPRSRRRRSTKAKSPFEGMAVCVTATAIHEQQQQWQQEQRQQEQQAGCQQQQQQCDDAGAGGVQTGNKFAMLDPQWRGPATLARPFSRPGPAASAACALPSPGAVGVGGASLSATSAASAPARLASSMVGGDHRFRSIPWSELQRQLKRLIGSGAYGQVWRARYMHEDVAVKLISINQDEDLGAEAVACFLREVDIQQQLSHANIVQLRGACCEYPDQEEGWYGTGHRAPVLAIVMEFCELGDLLHMIRKARTVAQALLAPAPGNAGPGPGPSNPDPAPGIPASIAGTPGPAPGNPGPAPNALLTPGQLFYHSWELRLKVAAGVAAGLASMHSRGVVHRDLTSYNVLLQRGPAATLVAKLCDFNLSRVVPSGQQLTKSQLCPNSPAWASPELLQGGQYGYPHDVYSFGVVLWEIITLQVPWEMEQPAGCGPLQLVPDWVMEYRQLVHLDTVMDKVREGQRLQLPQPENIQPPLPEAPQLLKLLSSCWLQDAEARPSMHLVADQLLEILERVRARRNGAGHGAGH